MTLSLGGVQGTRTRDGRLGPSRKGVGRLVAACPQPPLGAPPGSHSLHLHSSVCREELKQSIASETLLMEWAAWSQACLQSSWVGAAGLALAL